MIPLVLLASLAGATDASPDTEPAPPVSPGTWAMVVDVGSRSKVPVAGTAQVTTRSLVRLQLARTESGWEQRQHLCAVDIRSDTKADTVLPPAFIEHVPPERYPVQFERRGQTWTYSADPGPKYIGYDPERSGGRVPESKKEPGVVDHEGDGHPGATVLLQVPVLGAVRLYIAQKGWSRYQGRVVSDSLIEGRVQVMTTEQRTLGASVSLFAANPTIESVPERSRFRMVRIDEDRDCSALAASWDGAFEIPGR